MRNSWLQVVEPSFPMDKHMTIGVNESYMRCDAVLDSLRGLPEPAVVDDRRSTESDQLLPNEHDD